MPASKLNSLPHKRHLRQPVRQEIETHFVSFLVRKRETLDPQVKAMIAAMNPIKKQVTGRFNN